MDSLEGDCFNIIDVHDKEGEFADSNQAVFGRANLYHRLVRASSKIEVLNRDIKFDSRGVASPVCSSVPFTLLLNKLNKVCKAIVKLNLLLSLTFLLLQFIHVSETFACRLVVQVICSYSRLLEELHILDLLLAN